jgi:hypothetical protein
MRIELEDIAEQLDVLAEKIDLICENLKIEVNEDEFNELEENIPEEEFEPKPVESKPRKGSKFKPKSPNQTEELVTEIEDEEELEPDDNEDM